MIPFAVSAEEEPDGPPIAEPTAEQIRLNDQAVEALAEENFDRAVLFLQAAYEIGPINIIALNLGRAYQRQGDCENAFETLTRLPELPAIEAPPSHMINERAQDYLAELEESCREEEEEELEHVSAEPELQDQELIRPGDEMDEIEVVNPYATIGLIGIGSGAAFAATGLGFHLFARSYRDRVTGEGSFENGLNNRVTQQQAVELESQANLFDTIALGTTITGAVLIGGGLYLFINGAEHAGDTPAVNVSVSPEFQGITWSGSF